MQWIFLSITLHMFPGLVLTFDIVSHDVMEQAPKDSEEILAKNTLYLMLAYGGLLAISMTVIYFVVYTGAYPVFPENTELGAWNDAYLYTSSTKELWDQKGVSLNAAKALTMLMVTLFFCETMLIFQIRRPNKDVLTQFIEDSGQRMYFRYALIGLLVFALIAIMYIPAAQVALAEVGINFMFMYLIGLDILVCLLVSLITIIGFEVIKFVARNKGIVF